MDPLCRTIASAAAGKAAKAGASAPVTGRELLGLALALVAERRQLAPAELRGVARCKQLGNAGHAVLAHAELRRGAAASSASERAAALTACVLVLHSAVAVAVAVQHAASDSSAAAAAGPAAPSAAPAAYSHNDVKECGSLCARLAGDCIGAVAQLVVGAPLEAPAPALALLACLDDGLTQLGPSFRRLGVDVVQLCVVAGTAVAACRPLAARVLAAAVACLGRVRWQDAAAAGAAAAAAGGAGATSSGGKPAGSGGGGGGGGGGGWVCQPGPYVRAALSAIERHLQVARQAAAHVPGARLPPAHEVTTAFRAAGDGAGHQLSQLAGGGGGGGGGSAAAVQSSGGGIAAVDDGSASVPDRLLPAALASRVLLLVAALRHMVGPALPARLAPASPDTVTLPLAALLQLTSVLGDTHGLRQLLGGGGGGGGSGSAAAVVLCLGAAGSVAPAPAAEAVTAEALQLLAACVSHAGGHVRRYRTHVMRVLLGVMAQQPPPPPRHFAAADHQGRSGGTHALALAAAGVLAGWARGMGLGGGSDVDLAVARAVATCLHTLQAYAAGPGRLHASEAGVLLALTVLQDLVAAHWHGLPHGLRLVLERAAIALALGVVAAPSADESVAVGSAASSAASAALGGGGGGGGGGDDVMMLGGGVEETGPVGAGGGAEQPPAPKRQRGAAATAGAFAALATAAPPVVLFGLGATTAGGGGGDAGCCRPLRLAVGARTVLQHSRRVCDALHGLLTQCAASPWQGGALSPLGHALGDAVAALGIAAYYPRAPAGLAGLLARCMSAAELGAVKPPPGLELHHHAQQPSATAAAAPTAAGVGALRAAAAASLPPAAAPLAAAAVAAVPAAAAAASAGGSQFALPPATAAAVREQPAATTATTPAASAARAEESDDDFPDIVDAEPDA